MEFDTGFGVFIERIVGDTHTSFSLRNSLGKKTTKLGETKK